MHQDFYLKLFRLSHCYSQSLKTVCLWFKKDDRLEVFSREGYMALWMAPYLVPHISEFDSKLCPLRSLILSA